jgi:hypothetical protein
MNVSCENDESENLDISKSWFIVSVAETKTKLIVGLDEIFLQQEEGNLMQISNIEDLFENNLLIDWFHAFCSNKSCLSKTTRPSSKIEITETPETLRISFSPSNPFHWHAFCGSLFVSIQNGVLSNRRDISSLQVMILDNNDTLKELCVRQFNEFIQKEMMIMLLQLQII